MSKRRNIGSKKKNKKNDTLMSEKRKKYAESEIKRNKKNMQIVGILIVLIVGVIGAVIALEPDFSSKDSTKESQFQETNNDSDSEIKIPISEVDDGEIHYYENEETKFYVHKNPNGSFKTRISLCEPCDGKTFTLKEDGKIIDCDVCHTQWDSETYEGLSGGCQDYPPDYIEHKIENDVIIIQKSDLNN